MDGLLDSVGERRVDEEGEEAGDEGRGGDNGEVNEEGKALRTGQV